MYQEDIQSNYWPTHSTTKMPDQAHILQVPDRLPDNSVGETCIKSAEGNMPKLKLPDDFDEKSERALEQLEKYAAVCFWCGYGYAEYSPKLEDEHFAHHCPDAPEELRENARFRLLNCY